MRKALVGTLVVASLAAVGALSYYAGTRSAGSAKPPPVAAAPAKGPPPGVAVEATRVSMVKLPQAITAVGSLRSDETIIVRPEIAGRVAQINFREGQHVAKDALLVRLDD